jgi:serine/threonine protein kinase
MPYVRGVCEGGKYWGTSLKQLIENGMTFSIFETLWIAIQVCRGLWHCQSNIPDFVHGDIKPGNILFEPLDEYAKFDFGLLKYRVIISDFGIGGKTVGYFVSPTNDPATHEDDVYAYAMTMAHLFHRVNDLDRNSYYWRAFVTGVDELIRKEYSQELRRTVSFQSFFNGYAEAMESMFGLTVQAEDVLPEFRENDQSRVAKALNRVNYYTQIKKDGAAALKLLYGLKSDVRTETVYFDALPSLALVELRIAKLHYSAQNWELFDHAIERLYGIIEPLSRPIRYKGTYVYSEDLDSDLFIMMRMSRLLRGDIQAADELIAGFDADAAARDWLETLLYLIESDDERTAAFKGRLQSLPQLQDLSSPVCTDLNLILGLLLMNLREWEQALPHIRHAYQFNRDGIQELYLYGLCLYSTGEIIHSMMLFERVYDIYNINRSLFEKDGQIIRFALFSLFYMCDYQCLWGQCEIIRMLHPESATTILDGQMLRLEELSKTANESLEKWRMYESQVRNKSVDLKPALEIILGVRSRFLQMRAELPEYEIYYIAYRSQVQVFLESSRLLAELMIECRDFSTAIVVCDEMLRVDKSYYNAHYLRAGAFFARYMADKDEGMKAESEKSLALARQYVHAMFPGNQGAVSPAARQHLDMIEKYEATMDNI